MPAVTDDGIYPSFVRDQMIIDAGWDNWFGYDLIATDVDSDAFLRGFYKAHV